MKLKWNESAKEKDKWNKIALKQMQNVQKIACQDRIVSKDRRNTDGGVIEREANE